MKKLLLMLLVLGMSIAFVPMVSAQPQTECNDYTGAAFSLCNAYYALGCDIGLDKKSCQVIREEIFKQTGDIHSPCPCFDASEVQGMGIDDDIETFINSSCVNQPTPPIHLELFGARETSDQWEARVGMLLSSPTGYCQFGDGKAGFMYTDLQLNADQLEACIDIMINSQMFKQNNCPESP
jgi:hypothetical protein